jgi:hypothetical protein
MSEENTPALRVLSMEEFRALTVEEQAEYLRRTLETIKLINAHKAAAAEARLKDHGTSSHGSQV